MTHVLIATDGSDDAVAAAGQALQLLAPADTVTVLCAVEVPAAATAGQESGFAGGLAEPEAIDAAWDAVYDEARGALERTVAALATTAKVDQQVEAGQPRPGHLSGGRRAGGRRRGGRLPRAGAIRRALLGSVSTDVANNAPCPVMILRAP